VDRGGGGLRIWWAEKGGGGGSVGAGGGGLHVFDKQRFRVVHGGRRIFFQGRVRASWFDSLLRCLLRMFLQRRMAGRFGW